MPTNSISNDGAERIDHILKVDSLALLKSIRELEYKLSDYHRQDKLPPWALAFEARMASLEQKSNDIPLSSHSGIDATENNDQVVISIQNMTLEDKILQRMKAELNAKVQSSQLTTEMKISTFSLEVERLHKLLEIRPTSSEMQQIMAHIHEIERNVQYSIEDLSKGLLNSLKDKLISEMSSIIDEINGSKNQNEKGIRYLEQKVDQYEDEFLLMRQTIQDNNSQLEEKLQIIKDTATSQTEEISIIKTKYEDDIKSLQTSNIQLTADYKDLQRIYNEEKELNKIKYLSLENNLNTEIMKLRTEFNNDSDRLTQLDIDVTNLTTDMHKSKMNTEAKIELLASNTASTNEGLAIARGTIKDIHKQVNDILGMDFTAKLLKLDEQLNISNYDIIDIKSSLNTLLKVDIASLLNNVTSLQSDIIKTNDLISIQNLKLLDLQDTDTTTMNELKKNFENIKSIENKLKILTPIQDEISMLQNITKNTNSDLKNQLVAFNALSNSTEELSHRLVDAEEVIEQLEESISTRMNSVRDVLMETILEKQHETMLAMRNVKENLEVMSNVGDFTNTKQNDIKRTQQQKPMKNINAKDFDISSAHSNNGNDTGSVKYNANNSINNNSIASSLYPIDTQKRAFQRPNMTNTIVQGVPPPVMTTRHMSFHATNRRPSVGSVGGGGLNVNGGGSYHSINNNTTINANFPNSNNVIMNNNLNSNMHASPQQQPNLNFKNQYPPTTMNMNNNNNNNNSQQYNPAVSTTTTDTNYEQNHTTTNSTNHTTTNTNNHHSNSELLRLESRPSTGDPTRMAHVDDVDADDQDSSVVGNNSFTISVSHTNNNNNNNINNNDYNNNNGNGAIAMQHVSFNQHLENALDNMNIHSTNDPKTISEYNKLLIGNENAYPLFNEAQFLSDLCLNYENISMKRKKILEIPSVMCENIVSILQLVGENIAKTSDLEMVQNMIEQASTNTAATIIMKENDVNYDENFVVTKRHEKSENFLQLVTNLVLMSNTVSQPGIVRMDARTLFLSLLHKALDMFISKHNQVLVVGNSRIGKIKIPSCLACDRPLINKVRIEDGLNTTNTLTSNNLNLNSNSSRINYNNQQQQQQNDQNSLVLITSNKNTGFRLPSSELQNSTKSGKKPGFGAGSKRGQSSIQFNLDDSIDGRPNSTTDMYPNSFNNSIIINSNNKGILSTTKSSSNNNQYNNQNKNNLMTSASTGGLLLPNVK